MEVEEQKQEEEEKKREVRGRVFNNENLKQKSLHELLKVTLTVITLSALPDVPNRELFSFQFRNYERECIFIYIQVTNRFAIFYSKLKKII